MASSIMKRKYDVIVYGSTGFTGQLVCEYIKNTYGNKVKFAIAGRNVDKLQEVKAKLNLVDQDIIVASLDDINSINKMCSSATVILSTAGPYALYGTEIVKGCVKESTNYVDITGEAAWIRTIVDDYEEEAKRKGLKIVNSCGFDCVPADLGTMHLCQEFEKRKLSPPEEVCLIAYDAKGGASGGTIASAMNMFESTTSKLKELGNPFFLASRVTSPSTNSEGGLPKQPLDKAIVNRNRDKMSFSYDKVYKCWTMPYIMQSIDTRIVHRTNSLTNYKYGNDFVYYEVSKAPNMLAAIVSSALFPLVGVLLFFSITRNFLKRFLPVPGQGPSKKLRESGYFYMKMWGKSNGTVIKSSINAPNGDPGYKQTAVMISETALCLAFDAGKLPGNAGILTPASACGNALIDRLKERGIDFVITE